MSDAQARGNFVYVDFNRQAEHEQSGHRPAIVLSPKNFNDVTGFAVVCPITKHIKGYPFEVSLPDDSIFHGCILTDQVKSLDWRTRKFKGKGQAPVDVVSECLDKIKTFLT